VAKTVEERPDERSHNRERGHGEQQELRNLRARLVGWQGEEQGSG